MGAKWPTPASADGGRRRAISLRLSKRCEAPGCQGKNRGQRAQARLQSPGSCSERQLLWRYGHDRSLVAEMACHTCCSFSLASSFSVRLAAGGPSTSTSNRHTSEPELAKHAALARARRTGSRCIFFSMPWFHPSMVGGIHPIVIIALQSLENPLWKEDIWSIFGRVWPERMLSDDVPALPLPLVSAWSIFLLFFGLQVFCLLAYIIALLVDSVRWACVGKVTFTRYRNESGLARQLASDGFEAVQHKLPKLTKVQWEQQHCLDLDALKIKVWIMALDVLLDMNTIFSLLLSRTACLMFWRHDSSISLSCHPRGTFSSRRA